jgi:Tol biopolymer transport system component
MKLAVTLLVASLLTRAPAADLQLFSHESDIGTVSKEGRSVFDPASQTYHITGGGGNIWFTNDAFHFVYTEARGDLSLSAKINFPKPGGNPHRKAVLMLRQSLDPDSSYVDVAVHGNGLTSLQFRDGKGALTREVQTGVSQPESVTLVKRGSEFTLLLNASRVCSGAAYRLELSEPFYAGLGVCSHDDQVTEQADFSDVSLTALEPSEKAMLHSTIEIVPIDSKDRRVVWHSITHLEAPNWSRDGKSILFNSQGRIYRMALAGAEPEPIDTGFALRCNNDHGLSPDGSELAISDQTKDDHRSRIYILPIQGGEPRAITPSGPSYWHGWSPDGKTLAFCGEREGEFDVYTIPVSGGPEKRLTDAPGLDDGPDYSPDGKYIYFNSERSGSMQIWRMNTDGAGQSQLTKDQFNNWFPHPSPDGKWLAFLSYSADVKGHPGEKEVQLRLMNISTGEIQPLARLFGGQGTINVPSWSPDSKEIAFVSYHFGP